MITSDNSVPFNDFRIFEATPGISVMVLPDAPKYTVVAVSDDFVTEFRRNRKEISGMGYFDVLSSGVHSDAFQNLLRQSFESILANRKTDELAVQRTSWDAGPVRTWQLRNAPVLDAKGNLCYIIHTALDVTDKIKAEVNMASAKGIEKAYRFFMNAPVIIGYLRGKNYVIELANKGLLKVWGRNEDVIGKPLLEAIPELQDQGTKALLDEVCRSGKPFYAYEHPLSFDHEGKVETLYFDFIYEPLYEDEDGKVSGVISVGHDVTAQVHARNKFKNVIEQASDRIAILKGRDLILEVANQALYDFWKLDSSVQGKPLLEIFPELEGQGFIELINRVYDTGKPFHGYEVPLSVEDEAGKKTVYLNFTYQPYLEPDGKISGVVIMASDATKQVLTKQEAEEHYKQWKELANSMPAIVWSADTDGKMKFFNDQWYAFTGLSEEESNDVGWMRVFHPDDLDRCLKIWEEALMKEELYELEARNKRKDGSYRWMISRGVPIKKDGTLIGWYGTTTDIHEQKQLELHLEDMVRERTGELENKNKLLDSILKNSSNGISVSKMIFDDAGNVVDAMTILANDSAVRFSGLPENLYLSKPATTFDPNIISSPYGQTCLKTLRTGEPSVFQYFLEFTGKWLELSISKLDDSHLIHIFTDVTSIKNTQLALEKSLEDLKFANKNLEEFAYAASHDLKEPVRKIQYFANRLQEGLKEKLEPAQSALFERLETSSIRMQNLIDDLLAYSQAAQGSSEKEEIDLNQIIENVMQDLELEIQKKQAKIIVDSLPEVRANERQILQLFQNLLSNSLKYSRPGVIPEITILAKVVAGKDAKHDLPEARDKLFHLIEVSDNGIGFDPLDAERIFKVFTRVHSGVLYKGTGIGLSIVKKVVESHDGHVWAESQPEKGSTFKILLPKL